MRQLITRLDDALHARLKSRASEAGTSMNAYVVDVLRAAVSHDEPKEALRARLENDGRLVVTTPAGPAPGRETLIEELRGAADVVVEAIDAGRSPR